MFLTAHTRRVALVLASSLCLTVSVAGQSRSDEDYEELIHRLELGMSALEELGREDALHVLHRVADQVRDERAAARRGGENEEIREVRRRPRVMRHAVDARLEAGRDLRVALNVRFGEPSRA